MANGGGGGAFEGFAGMVNRIGRAVGRAEGRVEVVVEVEVTVDEVTLVVVVLDVVLFEFVVDVDEVVVIRLTRCITGTITGILCS